MVRSFTDAIGYVERNENLWSQMIRDCWQEWIDNHRDIKDPYLCQTYFKSYALTTYGIKCWWNHDSRMWEFQVINPTKYTFFQMKYAQ